MAGLRDFLVSPTLLHADLIALLVEFPLTGIELLLGRGSPGRELLLLLQ